MKQNFIVLFSKYLNYSCYMNQNYSFLKQKKYGPFQCGK